MALVFDRDFDPARGSAVELMPGIRRVTAGNPGPFTFRGTNSYLIGTDCLTVIDPGPDDPAHVAALLAAAGSAAITHILVTHTHRDHSPAARSLALLTGATIAGCGPHAPARPSQPGESLALDAAADPDHRPALVLADGEQLETPAGVFRAIATPGHTANHLAFALEGTGQLFSGDHVMAWSTTIVAPPDGSMAAYMASLERIAAAPETVYWPGHGGPVRDGPAFIAGLAAHRRDREAAIVAALAAGAATIPAIVAIVYADTDPRLHGAAARNVLAHLEMLVEGGIVTVEEGGDGTACYRPA